MTKLICILLLTISIIPYSSAKEVSLPISLEYPMLRKMMLEKIYTDKNQAYRIINENSGCTRVVLKDPKFTPAGKNLKFLTEITVNSGAFLMGKCMMPVKWDGFVEITQKVSVAAPWRLHFTTINSRLLDQNRNTSNSADIIWDMIKEQVHAYLDRIKVDLGPTIKDVKEFLLPLFPPQLKLQTEKLIDSMRPGEIVIKDTAVQASIIVDIIDKPSPVKSQKIQQLNEQELDQFLRLWESWDALLISQITSLADFDLNENDRQTLLDVLLDTRYSFVNGLAGQKNDIDFVRQQFITSWKKLAPIIRKYSINQSGNSIFNFLAYFTAADALSTLDQLGPTLGIEISRDGLLRLARMLNNGSPLPLNYTYTINSRLQKALGFEAISELPETPSLKNDPDQENKPEFNQINQINRLTIPDLLFSYLVSDAWAKPLEDKNKLKQWLVSKNNINNYLKKVQLLLNNAAKNTLKKSRLNKKYHDFINLMMQATAWQESCFRQFKQEKGKITYLRSYNSSSVGIMQINERVWRGLYDVNKLRWDIAYNAKAGSDVLERYLSRYALKKMDPKKPLDKDTLARVIYAMYNGGPGQFKKFLKRKKNKGYFLSDKLFWEKYLWSKQKNWGKLNKCLIGG